MGSGKAEAAFRRANARDFPRLTVHNFEITSPQTWRYNCIAWASGDDQRWWWPIGRYWPGGGPQTTSVDAFVMMFGTLGYVETDSSELEAGVEKVVLYVNARQQVTHAARQLPDGLWTSKLGQNCDISHTLEALEGGSYGSVARFLRRDVPTQGDGTKL